MWKIKSDGKIYIIIDTENDVVTVISVIDI